MVTSPVFTVLATTLTVISIAGAIALDNARFHSDFPPPLLHSEENQIVPELNSTVHERNIHRRDEGNVEKFDLRGGYVKYGFDNENRVSWAKAMINSDTYAEKKLGSKADQRIEPSGWNDIGVVGDFRHRCHLIGKQLGGSGNDGRNLFTCHRYANSPVMNYYETKVKKLVETFPKNGAWRRDKAVVHKVTLRYMSITGSYPIKIDLKSVLYMSGRFSGVLQFLSITMGSNSATCFVRFRCAGSFPQNRPPSLGVDRIRTSTIPCSNEN